jgi:hypothetical protein
MQAWMTPAVAAGALRAFFGAASAGTLRTAARTSKAARSSEVDLLIGIHNRVDNVDGIAA